MILSACDLFSPLGKLAGRAIYFANVFSLFYFNFLMVDFLDLLAQNLIDRLFVRSSGAAVGRWQSFDVPSAYRQRSTMD